MDAPGKSAERPAKSPRKGSGAARARLILTSMTALALTCVFFVQAGAVDLVSYAINQDGRTYGPAVNPLTKTPCETEPDLRAVRASNGESGYVHTSELNATLDRLRSMSNDELLEMKSVQADALVEESQKILGFPALGHDDALAYLKHSEMSAMMEQADEDALAAIEDSAARRIAEGSLSSDALGALASQGIIEAETAASLSARTADAARIDIGEARSLVSVPDSVLRDITSAAREATAIQLTVYESDGATEVGTIPFYLM